MSHAAPPNFRARAMVAALGVLWGLNWPAARLALLDYSPWMFRSIALWVGAAALLAIALSRRRVLWVPRARDRVHLVVAGLLNLAGFNLFSSFAQLGTTTTRVAIIAYTMPLWVTFLAWIVLGERLDRVRAVAMTLGAAGIAALIIPFLGGEIPIGMWFALGAAVSWAAGTVYVKWAAVAADPFVIAGWQLAAGGVAAVAGLLLFGGTPRLLPEHWQAGVGLFYNVVFGTALAYYVWFEVVAQLPAATAALGVLMVPVVGVTSAMLLVGDRPTAMDFIGFALVLTAAGCVLLRPAAKG
ncbi:MAG: DMT family transporter [Alphaproteobacteria bacterium]|nr:DMT family transporter [Alphaproteobacteria bacterium]